MKNGVPLVGMHIVDGNDMAALVAALEKPHQPNQPKLIIAKPSKAKAILQPKIKRNGIIKCQRQKSLHKPLPNLISKWRF